MMLDVRDVTVRFGDTVALDAVTLSVRAGEAVVLRGPSGGGKTTLLRVIAGLTLPERGEVWLQGVRASEPGRATPPHQRGVAFVFQEPRLWPHMTVADNVAFGIEALPPKERAERLARVAANTGILDWLGRYPGELSGGQKQRVAIARALAPRRPILLMDEPFTNLDDPARRSLGAVVQQAWEEDAFTMVHVTHGSSDEPDFASRTVRLEAGRLVDPTDALTPAS